MNEHAERSAHSEATLLCHLATCTLVDEKEIGASRFSFEYRCRLSGIESEIYCRPLIDDLEP